MKNRTLPLLLVGLITSSLLSASAAGVGRSSLTVQMIDDGTLPNYEGAPAIIEWLPDGEHYLQLKEGRLLQVDAETGNAVAYNGPFPSQVISSRGGPQETLPGPAKAKSDRELESTAPGKKTVAFVRNNDLYFEEAVTKKTTRLTQDGSSLIRNGKATWVYYEEIFDRKWPTYWWSPDGAHLAFFRTDDQGVPQAAILDASNPNPVAQTTAYPTPGTANPTVKLGLVSVADQIIRWADLSDYDKTSFLITRVGWLPDSKKVYCCIQDREQTWLDFCTVAIEDGKVTKLFRDSTPAWTSAPEPVQFLADRSFFITSERSGWKHIYHYDQEGRLLRQVTQGDWEVRSLERIDEKSGWIYFTGTRDNLMASNAYRAKLDGSTVERITKGKGNSQALFSPKGNYFVSTYSDVETPPQVRLYRTDGAFVRTIDANPVSMLQDIPRGGFERVQIPTSDGILLEASIQKPVNFDPAKKYPVWLQVYGGPQMPFVKDTMPKTKSNDEAIANMGFIVFKCDPRSASGKGAVSAWTAYRQLGVQELQDLETAVRWLTAKPWADATRVGISGHSYGGFLTAFALTHSKLFAAGVASSSPTDWHNYDSIYTERYMLTPEHNKNGYEMTSVVKAAKDLNGKLYLIHGLKDDNVHVGNSLQFALALQKANKDFEMMIYPTSSHGIGGVHYQRQSREFMKRVLQP